MSDVCTIVSIFPKNLTENKPQVPTTHKIDKGSYNTPALYYVGPGINNIYVSFDRPMIPTPVPAREIANAIVSDFTRACLAFRGDECSPGLFWLDGKVTEIDIEGLKAAPDFSDDARRNFVKLSDEPLQYVNPLKRAKRAQENWFSALVAMSDDDYAKTSRPGLISDLQRLAAKELGLTREWISNTIIKAISCKFCGSSILENVPVCAVCHNVVNQDLYDKLSKKVG